MTAPTARIRQDLPPEGGYHPINFRRIPSKQYFTSASLVIGYLILHWGALYLQNKNYKRGMRYDTEYRSGDFALLPMLRAERDRAYLKVIRRNRDEEERLMKDVPGWEVGTYYGDKIYHTRPADEWRDVDISEYFAHAPYRVAVNYMNWWKWM